MKYITILLLLISVNFAQVPDSVIVKQMEEIKAEFDKNNEIINQYQDRQLFLDGQYTILEKLLKEEIVEEGE